MLLKNKEKFSNNRIEFLALTALNCKTTAERNLSAVKEFILCGTNLCEPVLNRADCLLAL